MRVNNYSTNGVVFFGLWIWGRKHAVALAIELQVQRVEQLGSAGGQEDSPGAHVGRKSFGQSFSHFFRAEGCENNFGDVFDSGRGLEKRLDFFFRQERRTIGPGEVSRVFFRRRFPGAGRLTFHFSHLFSFPTDLWQRERPFVLLGARARRGEGVNDFRDTFFV